MADRTCPTCDTVFNATHGRQRYCAPTCRPDDHPKVPIICAECNEVVLKERSSRYKQFCGMPCRDQYMRRSKRGVYAQVKKPQPVRPPHDPRSRLRRAIEDGTGADVIAAIRAKVVVTDADCWEWPGKTKDGYATVTFGKRNLAVHRLSLEARLGQPLGDQPAHHICANPTCVNPHHLQPVSHRENIAEMLARTYMERRILALEAALADAAPGHVLLNEVSISAV